MQSADTQHPYNSRIVLYAKPGTREGCGCKRQLADSSYLPRLPHVHEHGIPLHLHTYAHTAEPLSHDDPCGPVLTQFYTSLPVDSFKLMDPTVWPLA